MPGGYPGGSPGGPPGMSPGTRPPGGVALKPPTDLTATVSGSDIVLTWTAASSVDGYNIYQSIDGGTWTKLNGTTETGLTYTLKPTDPGEYNFRVTSVRGDKESSPSAETTTTESMMTQVYTDTISGLRISAVDGTAFVDSEDESVYESDFSSDLDAITLTDGDETVTWVHNTDEGVLSVTTVGTQSYTPILIKYSILPVETYGQYYTVDVGYTVNSGTCKMRVKLGGVNSATTTLSGSSTFSFTAQVDTSDTSRESVLFYFDGRNTFNLSIHSITVTKHPAMSISADYADGNHLLEVQDSDGNVISGVLSAQGSGETFGANLWVDEDVVFEEGWSRISPNLYEFNQVTQYKSIRVNNVISIGSIIESSYEISNRTTGFVYSVLGLPHSYEGSNGTYIEKKTAGFDDARINAYLGFDGQVQVNHYKQVTAPSTSGATLVDEISGTTQNLFTAPAGFLYNEASYLIRVKKILPTV